MLDFKLDTSVEYQKIREVRKLINNEIIGGQGFNNPIVAAVSLIINRPDHDADVISHPAAVFLENAPAEQRENLNRELGNFTRKKEASDIIARPDLISASINDFNLRLVKNIYLIYAISNYSFAEYIFRQECETDELKKFRIGGSEDPSATLIRTIRRKAEEAYKNFKFDEAISFFNEAVSKYNGDFTMYYQLGMIYFFEKADFQKAMENFRLASKYSYNKYTPIHIHSMVFIGLLLRLYALNFKNTDMLNEAYQATYQAYTADTGYNFSKYALAQCTASMPFRADLIAQSNSLIKNLILNEKLFAVQIINDPAFNNYSEELEKLFKNIFSEGLSNLSKFFEKIDLALDHASCNQQYITIPTRLISIKSEYKKVVEQINNNKSIFDIESTSKTASKLVTELEDMAKEIEKNKKYSEIRAIIDTAISNYRDDLNEFGAPYLEVESKFNALKEQILKMNSVYPNADYDNILQNILNYVDPIEEKTNWRESGVFLLIKIISAGFTFIALLIILLILSTLFGKGVGNYFVIGGALIAMAFMPLYGTVLAEIYYNIIEIKRRNLLSDVKKLKVEIDVNKIKMNEINKKLVAKYVMVISEQTRLSSFTSEKMFEACLDGNYEQIKALMS